MNPKLLLFCLTSVFCSLCRAQSVPELPDPKPTDTATWQHEGKELSFYFTDISKRFPRHVLPDKKILHDSWKASAWRGEKQSLQLLLFNGGSLEKVSIRLSDLTDGQHHISATSLRAGFIRYTMTDGLRPDGGGCDIPKNLDSSLSADMIDTASAGDIAAYTVQPIWLTITVPTDARPGVYHGEVTLYRKNQKTKSLRYEVSVINHVLPPAAQWKFHLDLWQNPYSVARIKHTRTWSPEHFKAMTPYMEMLAAAGQKTITATLIYDPWNSQTYDRYGSMIQWTKKEDGSWAFDYSVFDAWVSYMMKLGIDKQINGYSMIPWKTTFHYYDEARGRDTFVFAKPGTPEYNDHWRPMLTDFAKHLKQKGWFGITTIAMDERPLEAMLQAIALIKEVDTGYKISLAGRYHSEIEADMFDYCMASNQVMPDSVLQKRHRTGRVTTFYTSCTEGFPNVFTFSNPADAVFLAWHASSAGLDGYLRWAYNCWGADAMLDSRFSRWSAGDAFLIYPGPRTSMRFEMLKKGIQDYEKIAILKTAFAGNPGKLQELEKMVQGFSLKGLQKDQIPVMVEDAEKTLNTF